MSFLRDPFTMALALLAWSGVLLQLSLSLERGPSIGQGLVAYLGYFTVLTNVFVASALSAQLLRRPAWLARPQVLACAAVSIALVGIAYHLLLRKIWDPQGAQWLADMLLHYATPWLYVLWWVVKAPLPAVRWWWPLAWASYPTGYLAYALLRGAWLGHYPYPFIDVAQLGYGRTAVNALGLLGVFLVIAWALVGLKRWKEKRT